MKLNLKLTLVLLCCMLMPLGVGAQKTTTQTYELVKYSGDVFPRCTKSDYLGLLPGKRGAVFNFSFAGGTAERAAAWNLITFVPGNKNEITIDGNKLIVKMPAVEIEKAKQCQ